MNILRIVFIGICFYISSLMGMTANDKREIDQIIQEIPLILNEAHENLAQIKKNLLEEKANQEKSRSANVIWQNTVLAKTGDIDFGDKSKLPGIGIYNKDIFDGCLFAGNIASDIYLYRRCQNNRIEKIVGSLKTKYQEIITEIEKIKKAQVEFDKKYDEKNSIGKFFTNSNAALDRLNDSLRLYIKENHSLIYYNPFNQVTIGPLLLKFLIEKLSQTLCEKALERPHLSEINRAYVEKNGTINTLPLAPFSSMSIVKFIVHLFVNPSFGMGRALSNTFLSSMSFSNIKLNLGLPHVIYSSFGRGLLQFLALGLGIKIFDSTSTLLWSNYVIEHKEKLLKLLNEYKSAKENFASLDSIKKIEVKIEKFVKKGHNYTSVSPRGILKQGWSSYNKGQSSIYTLFSLPVFCILAAKAYTYFKN